MAKANAVILGFTGSRRLRAPSAVSELLRERLARLRPKRMLIGMAEGADLEAASVAVELGMPFVAVLPFAEQTSSWRGASKRRHARLLEAASKVVVVSGGEYNPRMYAARNAWIVRHATALLAVWDGASSGAHMTIVMAQRAGLPVATIMV